MNDTTKVGHSQEEAGRMIAMSFAAALRANGAEEGFIQSVLATLASNYKVGFADYLYVPDATLLGRLAEYQKWCKSLEGDDSKVDTTEAGRLMEEIATLAFRCIKGWDTFLSYRSYSQQHDLVISGNQPEWFMLMCLLHLPDNGRTIVVEAKNLQDVLSDELFTRLCYKIQNTFETTCHLGVFLTRHGASGFPKRGGGRKESLQNARATQILFRAITRNKYVIVLDQEDILMLGASGALPRILEAKIREVEAATGLPYEFSDDWVCVDLPPHLKQYFLPQTTDNEGE